MKPGDIISWVYKFSGKPVEHNELLRSSVSETYVPIGGISTLIAIDGDVCTYYDGIEVHTTLRNELTVETTRWDPMNVQLRPVQPYP